MTKFKTELSDEDLGIVLFAGVVALSANLTFDNIASIHVGEGKEPGPIEDPDYATARDAAGQMVVVELLGRNYTRDQILALLRAAIRDFKDVHPRLNELYQQSQAGGNDGKTQH